MSFAIAGAMILGTGASIYNAKKSRDAMKDIQFGEAPEYEEAEWARGLWQDKLQEWGKEPGYGAISPDWEDIWGRAKGKVSRYFWGSPTSPGLAGKVKASAARRGVSESPALEEQLTKMGQEESIQLGDMASEQALQESLFGEQGRQNWMGQVMGLGGQKPQVASYMPQQDDTMGELGGATGRIIGNYQQQNWYEDMMNRMYGNQELGSSTSRMNTGDMDWLSKSMMGQNNNPLGFSGIGG